MRPDAVDDLGNLGGVEQVGLVPGHVGNLNGPQIKGVDLVAALGQRRQGLAAR